MPFADNPEVLQAANTALAAVAAPYGKPEEALLRGLDDPMAARRAAAAVALCRATSPDRFPNVRKLLKDPAPGVRLRTALALAEASDAAAVPVLIELLADLPIDQRKPVEELLQQIAGEWSPALNFACEDEIGRKNPPRRLGGVVARYRGRCLAGRRSQTHADRRQSPRRSQLIASYPPTISRCARQPRTNCTNLAGAACRNCANRPRIRDAEAARRAKLLIAQIEDEPSIVCPPRRIRLLALRNRPALWRCWRICPMPMTRASRRKPRKHSPPWHCPKENRRRPWIRA